MHYSEAIESLQSACYHRYCFVTYNGMQFKYWKCCVLLLSSRASPRDFYAVIVDEGEARINYPRREIESE